ncbi:hypothetical protein K7A17_19860 [Escherichia fergusonii]|uniref:Uncharacterized protein n=1 Tax=Escherichia fergusonii TaxID=564 RepID=A0A7W3I2C9_ESCFE|nr:hypothetical protein [Escherichia fergusonii]EHG6164535.1 hypothetical protein [Escherichia fergusonii]EHG7565422.1 hypothetical protein [Escherichia fergusonii]MBA8233922.1 hypothetical protein [Escherichia fergusonii]MBA8244942.1 hypothetical protein [Escherichia fergusonii]
MQKSLGNRRWLIDIDGSRDVYEASRLPGNTIMLKNGTVDFQFAVINVQRLTK